MVMRPIVAQVAAEEPEIAAKIVQPTTLVWSSRPGMRDIHGARPRNMSSDSLERNRISPIQMNSGSAVKVQLELDSQTLLPSRLTIGRSVNKVMPSQPTPNSASPIHTPAPSSRN